MYKIQQKILSFIILTALFGYIFAFLPVSEAHILVIGDSNNYNEASKLGSDLKAKGYNVLELYKENATDKNILKGMYGADAVIYAGHGGYMAGNYDETKNNTPASPPFALVGTDNFIWGVGDQMREGWSSTSFTAPFKDNIPVILLHACFSTGWVENNEVSNPIETIYNFARMFTGAGANYYATAWNGAEIVYDFLNGATDFSSANNQNYEKITKYTVSNGTNGTPVWRNDHGYAAFVGDWSGKFPTVSETTAYDDAAAESWYNSNRARDVLTSRFTVSSSPYYVNQTVTFTDTSSDVGGYITSYSWDFGDGSTSAQANSTHAFSFTGKYTITHTVTDNNTKNSTATKTITVTDQSAVTPTPVTPAPVIMTPSKPNYTYKYVKKYKYKGKWRYKVVYVLIQKYLKKYKYKGHWKYKWVTKKITWS